MTIYKRKSLQHPLSNSATSTISVDHFQLEPYIGPRPFQRDIDDEIRFFGRDYESKQIVARILGNQIVLIYGASGVGKTSIMNAQVISALEESGSTVLPTIRISRVYSAFQQDKLKDFSNIHNLYIFSALQCLKPYIDPKTLTEKSFNDFLNDYFEPSDREDGEFPFVIIFDQFEELFLFNNDSSCRNQQEDFFRQMTEALDKYSNLSIVFIIREEYLAQLDPFTKILTQRKSRFRLEGLDKDRAVAAIKGPLTKTINNMNEQEKRDIEKEINELVDDLLKINIVSSNGSLQQLEGEFIEPVYLQVACSRWWNNRNRISAEYQPENKKDKGNDISKYVTKVFEDLYEQVILKATKETRTSEKEIRDWCQQKLITSNGTRSIIHRDRDTTGGLSNHVIKILEDMFFIRRQWRAGSLWYELTHDRIIKAVLDSNRRWKNKRSKIREFRRYFSENLNK